jgi:multidrug efflux system outer membrane protein
MAYAEWQWRGVRLSLAAEVATTYFTLLQYKRDYEIALRSSQLRKESAALIDSIFQRGMATGLNLERAKNLVYTAEADIPVYDRAIRQTLLSLNVLLGEMPDSADYANLGTRTITDYQPLVIPAGVPSDILHRRPDVMSAYWQMEQAAANVGIARSERFPSISLTAEGGRSSVKIGELFKGDSRYWSVLGSLAQPIFGFGTLRRKEMAAREQYR